MSADYNYRSAVRGHKGTVLFSVAHGAEFVKTAEHELALKAKANGELLYQ